MSVNPDTNDVEFKLIDYTKVSVIRDKADLVLDVDSIDFSDVYRAMVKFVIGMLPTSELKHFKKQLIGLTKIAQLHYQILKKQSIKNLSFIHSLICILERKMRIPYLIYVQIYISFIMSLFS